ncbi:hypothetical protein PsorP6_003980 [Peronosclerospora sorghi]|uniref:Uncharacterized protein n=1 Tax=Peronosclerospora sorghi TaxID=230839 RepID=A0ACC0VK55_9STRA|nr:hypothetical protein PsorP6_003980 [Peronosclerospora sorghi]
MGIAQDQLFVRIMDAPEVSFNGETCVEEVARVCGLAVTHEDNVRLCILSGFVDSKQQLAVACMLHWQLQQAKKDGATVSVSDSESGTCFTLAEMLNCDEMAPETCEGGAVRVLSAAAFADELLQQDSEKKVQVLDCREEDEFLGLVSGKEVSGHLEGAKNVPFASIFTAYCATDDGDKASMAMKGKRQSLLSTEELRDVFKNNDIDLERPVAVIGSVPAEAAAVATALLIAGQCSWVAFCIDALSDKLAASFPSSYTADTFEKDRLLYKDGEGKFDLSPQSDDMDSMTNVRIKEAAQQLGKTYENELSGEAKKLQGGLKEKEEEKTKEIVWIKDGHRFFDMPCPVSKSEFLDASRTIFRVVSFVLAPFGFPASLRKKRSLQEVKTQCGSLFQDVIEVCSDLIYQQKNLTEGAMAMSVHKWVEEKQDCDCSEQVKAINELWDVLYDSPVMVEVPDLSEENVLELAIKLEQRIRKRVGQRTPWAFHIVDEEEEQELSDEEHVDIENNVTKLEEQLINNKDTDEIGNENGAADRDHIRQEEEIEHEDAVIDSESMSKECEFVAGGNTLDEVNDKSTITTKDSEVNQSKCQNDLSDNKMKAAYSGLEEKGKIDREQFKPMNKLAESWKFMYPSVVYTLGFVPQNVGANNKKLSTLQIKSLIQAIAEASLDVMKGEPKLNSQIEFQALCETLRGEKREQWTNCVTKAIKVLYVLKHFLTRKFHTDNLVADKLDGVRNAVRDGDMQQRTGHKQVALVAYSKAFDYLPLYHEELENAIVGRARCFLDMNELSRAKNEALIALKLNPYSIGAYECLGSVEEQTEHPDIAMQHYVTSFVLDGSRSPELAERIDRVSRLVGRRDAKALFPDMKKVHELPSAWLVDSYFGSFEHDVDHAARVPVDIAKKRDVNRVNLDATTLLYRAIHYKRTKTYGEAQRDIWMLVSKDVEMEELSVENRALALNLHASLLYVAGDVLTAMEVINKSLEFQPMLVNSLVKKGGFLAELGQTDEAKSCFLEAMELNPNEPDVHLHFGQMELLDGHYYEAMQCLRRCISLSDALPVTHVSYGMALYKSGSTYQAKDVFEEASNKFPESAEVHLFHGEVLTDQGNYADAMRHFLTAWKLSPQCPLPFLNAGRVYVATNDPVRAIAHFEQALEVDPRCSSAHLDIAQVLFAQGRTSEAFDHFKVAALCCRFLPEVEEVCACQEMAKMQLKVTEILGVELRHIMRTK